MELKTLFACALMNIWMYLRHFLHPVDSCFKPLQQKLEQEQHKLLLQKVSSLVFFYIFLLDTNDML
jgi:hypothetical protein